MAAFARPENALKRADDLIAVGQKDHALQTLHDIITSKRNRVWSKVLEDIMKKYVQLCVDMRKGKFAKEGLHQYKIICQQVNVNSLEVVIKHYLQIAEGMAKEAQSKAKQTILDIEDLEAEESAESIILTAVSGEDRTDRTDREIVTPWLRFLWETYRTVLETLRNSAKLESLYHETAQQAFNFCLRYQRKNEFRRLSDILRNHLSNLGKYPNQPQTINLNNPETLQIHLETRFAQLNVATELELWQEAFRSVEDIHGLMTMAHKPLTAQMMATYFNKLARIFWVSNNYLFHAYAWFKYFVIARGSLKEKPEEFRTMASSVLLAALSIPLAEPKLADEQYFEYDLQKEKNLRMGSLLGFTITPKREFLLQDLVGKKVTQMVFPELQDIYVILEKRFSPLQLCQKMAQKFEFIRNNPALAQYEEQLQKLTFLRLIQQLSQVYESMKITDFKKMISFMDDHTIEKLLVNAVKRRFAGGLRIDHQNGAIHFSGNDSSSEQIRDQLTQLAKGLQDASKLIHPKPEDEEAKIKDKREAFVRIINSLRDEPAKLAARHKAIELRRAQEEERVRRQNELRKQEENRKVKLERDEAEKRAKIDAAKRKKKSLKDKKQNDEQKEKIDILLDLGVSATTASQIQDPQAYIEKQLANVQQQKKEQEAKLTALTTELAHRERAHREVEKALLEEQLKLKKVQDQEHYEQLLEKSITSQKQQHAIELAEKQRLSRMAQARAVFEERVMGARRAEYEAHKADQDRRLAEIKRKREEEALRIQQEEEERRKQIEEEKRAAEERERERKRKEEEKKQEELEKRRKQQEQIEIQRKREEEALRKRKEEEEQLAAAKKKREEEEREKRDAERRDREASWRKPEAAAPATAAGGSTWRKDERPPVPAGGDRDRYVPPSRTDSDRWGNREAAPRREDSWRRPGDDRRPDDRYRDEPRRDDRGREDSWRSSRPDDRRPEDRDRRPEDRDRRPEDRGDSWRSTRDEPPRREESWRGGRDDRDRPSRDEPARREESWRGGRDDRDSRPLSRDEPPRREESWRRGGDEPRREDSRRDEPRREDSRRDAEPRREDSRRDEPRREDSRRDEPRREDSRRDERPAWGGKRDEGEKVEGAWRKPESERREPERRESERRIDSRDAKERESPKEEARPAKEEAKPEGKEEKKEGEDGWGVVTSKRRGGGRK